MYQKHRDLLKEYLSFLLNRITNSQTEIALTQIHQMEIQVHSYKHHKLEFLNKLKLTKK